MSCSLKLCMSTCFCGYRFCSANTLLWWDWLYLFHMKSGWKCVHHELLLNGMRRSNSLLIWRWVTWHSTWASGTWTTLSVCLCIHLSGPVISTCWSCSTTILIGCSTKFACTDRVLRCWFKCWDNKLVFKIRGTWHLKNRWWFLSMSFRKRQPIGW